MSEISHVIRALVALIGVTVIGFTVVGSIAFYRAEKGQAVSFGLLFQRGNFLRLGTVALIILAVVLLALVGKLTEGAAAVLSGLAGYVLGGLDRQLVGNQKRNDEKES